MTWLVSTKDLIAQNIFMVLTQYVESKEDLYNELEECKLHMFKDNVIISYRIQKSNSNIFAKLRGYGINVNNTFKTCSNYIWYTGNIHEVYKLLTRIKCDLWNDIRSLREELAQMRTAMKELEEYIFNLNAELLKNAPKI